jgi:hypothetical protein
MAEEIRVKIKSERTGEGIYVYAGQEMVGERIEIGLSSGIRAIISSLQRAEKLFDLDQGIDVSVEYNGDFHEHEFCISGMRPLTKTEKKDRDKEVLKEKAKLPKVSDLAL